MEKEYTQKTKEVLDRLGINAENSGVSTGTEWFATKGDKTVRNLPLMESRLPVW